MVYAANLFTGVSATRDVGDEIVCAAMHVLLLCAAFESYRSSVSLAVAFVGINLFSFDLLRLRCALAPPVCVSGCFLGRSTDRELSCVLS